MACHVVMHVDKASCINRQLRQVNYYTKVNTPLMDRLTEKLTIWSLVLTLNPSITLRSYEKP